MNRMVAFCGLVCTSCPGFIATQKDDYALRQKVAESWSTDKESLKPEDINCDGCLPGGKRTISFCSICEVRKCGIERQVENCAHCDQYPCKKLERAWEMLEAPTAKATLDEIRHTI